MTILSFPPVEQADENGLLAIGGDLELSSLILAYSQGIFPWPISSDYPLAWFSPDPRGILFYKNLRINRSLKKALNKSPFKITFNQDFPAVIENCALIKNRPGQQGTWITDEIIDAFTNLHDSGYAYSVKAWHDEELVGGVYGVCIDNYVSGESMFYTENNASKIALVHLMEHLHENNVEWLDTQMVTPIVKSLGGTEIPRSKFLEMLERSRQQANPTHSLFPFPA